MTTVDDSAWQDTAGIEELLLEAGQGSADAELKLLEILKKTPEAAVGAGNAETRQTWQGGMEFLLEEWLGKTCSGTRREILLEAARTGIDNALLRDLLAAAARRRFTEYLDPAGMIDALGVMNRDVAVVEVHRRWHMFELLAKGTCCIHPVHGAGTIVDVDDLANEVSGRFAKKVTFETKACLESIAFVRPGTVLAKVCAGDLSAEEAVNSVNGDRSRLAAHMIAAPGQTEPALNAVVGAAAKKKRKAKSTTKKAKTENTGRRWDEARSLHELLEILRGTEQLDLQHCSFEAVGHILRDAALRKEYASEFAEAVSRLWGLSPEKDWLETLLSSVREQAWCWKNANNFAAVTDDVAGRLLPHWMAASKKTLGVENLCEYTVRLPLRLWPYVEKTLQDSEGAQDLLAAAAVRGVKADPGSPDAALWLWKSKRPERRVLADASLIFRLLAIPVAGSYIKASKQLRKLLLEDDTYQRFLLQDGNDVAVSSLVQCARGLSVLNSGETQSLLVRIVRLFPEAKPLVEKRDRKRVTKAMPSITSFRSYEAFRKELQDIINVRIPENSRAIAHARSYGDLRENAEYKAAKEEQAYLSARRHELESSLAEIQASDFTQVEVDDRVVPGCTVVLAYPDGQEKTFHLMGLWDSEPDAAILSYDTPLGRALLGAAVGDSIALPSGETATLGEIRPLSEEMLEWALGE